MESLQVKKSPEGKEAETEKGPWRKSPPWNEETLASLKTDVRSFVPPAFRGLQHVNILLIGPVGAGKSSFFNTISSIFKGGLSSQAVSGHAGTSETSITTVFRTYCVRDKENKRILNFRLCDTRGLEEGEMLDGQEIDLVLNGNIFDSYKHGTLQAAKDRHQSAWYLLMSYLFPERFPKKITLPGYQTRPSCDRAIHCVCFVLDASTASVLHDRTINKIKFVQGFVRDRAIPQAFLLTKMDKVCPKVDNDVSAIFRSHAVKDVVENIAQLFGVPRSHVLPLKNFENEADVSMEISILALFSLKVMLNFAEDFLFDLMDRNDDTICSDSTD